MVLHWAFDLIWFIARPRANFEFNNTCQYIPDLLVLVVFAIVCKFICVIFFAEVKIVILATVIAIAAKVIVIAVTSPRRSRLFPIGSPVQVPTPVSKCPVKVCICCPVVVEPTKVGYLLSGLLHVRAVEENGVCMIEKQTRRQYLTIFSFDCPENRTPSLKPASLLKFLNFF